MCEKETKVLAYMNREEEYSKNTNIVQKIKTVEKSQETKRRQMEVLHSS